MEAYEEESSRRMDRSRGKRGEGCVMRRSKGKSATGFDVLKERNWQGLQREYIDVDETV